jgi:ERCC4-related helicase
MSWRYTLDKNINLFVKGRILEEDAIRQQKTAAALLNRLENFPGQILADEVGMGKTFVALSVAVSVALQNKNKRPVVIMIPPILKSKWPKDLEVFKEKCLPATIGNKIRGAIADSTVSFLKLLDDPLETRNSIIFLTHGAFHRTVSDGFIKLAIVQRALYRKKNTHQLRNSLERFGAQLFRLQVSIKNNQDVVSTLLNIDSSRWKYFLINNNMWSEQDDDPVPYDLIKVLYDLDSINFSGLYNVISGLPMRVSSNLNSNISQVRNNMNAELGAIWNLCIQKLKIKLPLLILDEAHHLKNAHTKFASLFQSSDDAAEIANGHLTNVFERMLFLTATPFQLGHFELCNVMNRFNAVSWNVSAAPPKGKEYYEAYLSKLSNQLDHSQKAALRLDEEWQKLVLSDLEIDSLPNTDVSKWWHYIMNRNENELSAQTHKILQHYSNTKTQMTEAEKLLKMMVIRHMRNRELPNGSGKRRKSFPGNTILHENESSNEEGLALNSKALLPFLLAARLTAITPESRPVFAEGLASSFEAFLHTRNEKKKNLKLIDDDSDSIVINSSKRQDYYLGEIERFLKKNIKQSGDIHTKMSATIDKVAELWLRGEKVLVFCHYVATGIALRNGISSRIQKEIIRMGQAKMKCGEAEVFNELEKIGNRFDNGPLKIFVDEFVITLINEYKELENYKADLIEVVRRYLRTPSFLIRFFPLEQKRFDEQQLKNSFEKPDYSQQTVTKLIRSFLEFLQERCGENERKAYIDALYSIQTGGIRGKQVESSFGQDELNGAKPDTILPNVRLANGNVKDETRQRLMLTFNTPFYPDVLIASSVMAEGVDLHLNCRYIIHHDLCWNPSTLEQRTGRVDRIGAKAEVCLLPINIYLPFIAETQDEKMYRVVMDRERWFKVVMGENYKVDAFNTDKMAERILFPAEAAEELAFKLGLK